MADFARIHVLEGTLSVTRADGSTEEPSGNLARLLALLVAREGKPVSVTEIADAVWTDLDPDLVGRQQVERLISNARDLLGDAERRMVPVRKHDHYRLDLDELWVDVVEFERLARAGEEDAARELWRADPVVLPDEWERVKALHASLTTDPLPAADVPVDAAAPPRPASPARRRRSPVLLAGAVLLVGLVAAGVVVAIAGAGGGDEAEPAARTAVVRVYNIEAACQRRRVPECDLGLARDPYANYTPANISRRVFHGDRLRVVCSVPNGSRIESEDGRPSTVWYRVAGTPATWLPQVRVQRGREPHVARCPA